MSADARTTIAQVINAFGDGGHPIALAEDSLRFFARAYVLECLARAEVVQRRVAGSGPSADELMLRIEQAREFVRVGPLWAEKEPSPAGPDCAVSTAVKRRGGRPRRRLP